MKKLIILVFFLSTAALAGQQNISNTGAVFTLDTSVPGLGQAYRDPSGLIWGDIVTLTGGVNSMTGAVANQYCTDLGWRLPTLQEFEQLMTYLGDGTKQGYSPYTADGSTEVLPGLVEHKIWSSTLYDFRSAYVFLGGLSGGIGFGYFNVQYAFARCVSP